MWLLLCVWIGWIWVHRNDRSLWASVIWNLRFYEYVEQSNIRNANEHTIQVLQCESWVLKWNTSTYFWHCLISTDIRLRHRGTVFFGLQYKVHATHHYWSQLGKSKVGRGCNAMEDLENRVLLGNRQMNRSYSNCNPGLPSFSQYLMDRGPSL